MGKTNGEGRPASSLVTPSRACLSAGAPGEAVLPAGEGSASKTPELATEGASRGGGAPRLTAGGPSVWPTRRPGRRLRWLGAAVGAAGVAAPASAGRLERAVKPAPLTAYAWYLFARANTCSVTPSMCSSTWRSKSWSPMAAQTGTINPGDSEVSLKTKAPSDRNSICLPA